MDDVLKRFDLEREDLNIKCPRDVINRIAGEIIDEWDMIGRLLEVSYKALKSIPLNHHLHSPEDKAVAMLDAWAEEYGREATCLKLAEVLHERKKTGTLEKFCELVKPKVVRRISDRTQSPSNGE